MSKDERNEIIGWLLMWSNWNKQALDNMEDRELRKLHVRYLEVRENMNTIQ